MNKLLYLSALALMSVCLHAQIPDVSVYADCSKNGYTKTIPRTAAVNPAAGRTSCEYVQLWAGGPHWATFNVGATITDYANLTAGTDHTSGNVAYYNTANVGGLYAWNNPNLNGRKTTWNSSVSTGISDVATTLWGSNWKTPTREQLDTLQNSNYGKTTWTWCDGSTNQYVAGCTLKGYKVSGVGDYASYSIFLPAAGGFYYGDGTVYSASSSGDYWSSTESGSDGAYYLLFGSGDRYIYGSFREGGLSVRAVLAQQTMESVENVTITLYADGCSAPNVITCSKGQQLRINAVDIYGYHFTQWTDGNTSNPRQVQVTGDKTYTAQFDKNSYTITLSKGEHIQSVLGAGTYSYLAEVTVYAEGVPYYQFDHWSDGNADNPRTLIVTQDTFLTAFSSKIRSGKCGENLTWNYSDGIIVISGTGAMYDYTQSTMPWILYKDSITDVVINNGCTSIGSFAFYGLQNRAFTNLVLPQTVETIAAYAFANCNRLTSISLPASLLDIANYAFSGCISVDNITSLATTRPDIYENTFKDVSNYAYLYVPCDYKRSYQLNSYWNRFDLQCVGAEPSTNPVTDVTVVPTENTVTITWPTNTNANSYTIEIKKDGITFCTLTFNDQGQLMNISFAPGRGSSNDIAMAEAVAGGYKFTVTSLSPGTKYNYEVDTKDTDGTTIKNYTGEFMTKQLTALEEISFPLGEDQGEAFKFIKDNQLYILQDGKTYNTQGTRL